MKKNWFLSESLEWEDLGGGVSRQILGYDDQVMMVKVRFEKGAIGYLHHHPHTQATYVAEGAFEVTIDEDMKTLKEGDAFFAHGDIGHGVKCLEPGILVDVFSPKREDFIK